MSSQFVARANTGDDGDRGEKGALIPRRQLLLSAAQFYPLLQPRSHFTFNPAYRSGADFYALWKPLIRFHLVDHRTAQACH
jgi:hypothetical protein